VLTYPREDTHPMGADWGFVTGSKWRSDEHRGRCSAQHHIRAMRSSLKRSAP